MAQQRTTRQRLLDEGMRLFADRGFDATSVGEIEKAAGLQPRRGGLYKHFESKDALLTEAVRTQLEATELAAEQIDRLDVAFLADADDHALKPLVRLVGEWFLAEMDRLENLTRVFEHDGQRLGHLRPEVKDRLVDLSYRATVRVLQGSATAAVNVNAAALMIQGPLVALRRTEWTYGSRPLDITDSDALDEWVELVLLIIRRLRNDLR